MLTSNNFISELPHIWKCQQYLDVCSHEQITAQLTVPNITHSNSWLRNEKAKYCNPFCWEHSISKLGIVITGIFMIRIGNKKRLICFVQSLFCTGGFTFGLIRSVPSNKTQTDFHEILSTIEWNTRRNKWPHRNLKNHNHVGPRTIMNIHVHLVSAHSLFVMLWAHSTQILKRNLCDETNSEQWRIRNNTIFQQWVNRFFHPLLQHKTWHLTCSQEIVESSFQRCMFKSVSPPPLAS